MYKKVSVQLYRQKYCNGNGVNKNIKMYMVSYAQCIDKEINYNVKNNSYKKS